MSEKIIKKTRKLSLAGVPFSLDEVVHMVIRRGDRCITIAEKDDSDDDDCCDKGGDAKIKGFQVKE